MHMRGAGLTRGPSPLHARLRPQATVYVSAQARDILIVGVEHMNRAVHDDMVAVEVLPEAHWRRPDSSAPDDEGDTAAAAAPASLAPGLDAPLPVHARAITTEQRERGPGLMASRRTQRR